jgi:hypothetical protein
VSAAPPFQASAVPPFQASAVPFIDSARRIGNGTPSALEIGSTRGLRARATAPADAQPMGETAPCVPVRTRARRVRPGRERERASNATGL